MTIKVTNAKELTERIKDLRAAQKEFATFTQEQVIIFLEKRQLLQIMRELN